MNAVILHSRVFRGIVQNASTKVSLQDTFVVALCWGIEIWTKECTNWGLIIGKRKYWCFFFCWLGLFSSEHHEDLAKKKKKWWVGHNWNYWIGNYYCILCLNFLFQLQVFGLCNWRSSTSKFSLVIFVGYFCSYGIG